MSRRGNHAGVCGCGDSPSPSSLLFRVTWAGQRSSEWDGLVADGENSQVWGMVVPGCLVGKQCTFCICCICEFSQRGRSPLLLRVLVHIYMGEARLSGHNLESGVGRCQLDCGGLSLP